jgi:hypothetical protein
MATLIVHCGLHKTGTTALQDFLAAHDGALRARGVLYPKTGRSPGLNGHHHLSWQMSRDRRYDPRHGSLDTLFAEIDGFGGTVVVSSEDFESLLTEPRRWSPLLTRAAAAGWDVAPVIYLRDPLRYLESVYLEQIKHGCGDEFDAVRKEAMTSGQWRFNEWVFHFDYSKLMRDWTAAGLPPAQWRCYDQLNGASIIDDFMSVLGMSLPATDTTLRSNTRFGWADSLLAFATSRSLNRRFNRVQMQQAVRFLAAGHDPALSVGIADVRTLLNAGPFAASRSVLDRFVATHGQGPAVQKPVDRATDEPAPALSIERVFSFESFVILHGISTLLPDRRHETTLDTLKQNWDRLARTGVQG